MITAYSTTPRNAPVRERELPQYASFEEALQAMQADAKQMKQNRPPPKVQSDGKPSPRELQALRALSGSMTSAEVAEAMGESGSKHVAGYLSGLAAKGFTERVGSRGSFTLWRRTRKGRKWT